MALKLFSGVMTGNMELLETDRRPVLPVIQLTAGRNNHLPLIKGDQNLTLNSSNLFYFTGHSPGQI